MCRSIIQVDPLHWYSSTAQYKGMVAPSAVRVMGSVAPRKTASVGNAVKPSARMAGTGPDPANKVPAITTRHASQARPASMRTP